jgi:hypothetical protein
MNLQIGGAFALLRYLCRLARLRWRGPQISEPLVGAESPLAMVQPAATAGCSSPAPVAQVASCDPPFDIRSRF